MYRTCAAYLHVAYLHVAYLHVAYLHVAAYLHVPDLCARDVRNAMRDGDRHWLPLTLIAGAPALIRRPHGRELISR